jgi:Iron-sulfur cluster binding domain of dihydroorotate dehydrogenase B
MKESQAIIERVTRLNEHYQRLHLTVEDFTSDLKPGHSLLARRLPERWDPYLREQWWPVALAKNTIVVERPGSIIYEPGQVVSLLGVVGQPFRYKRTVHNVLLMAHDTAPTPLVMSIGWLQGNGVSVTLVLSGKARLYPTQHLHPEVEIIQADDALNWPNRVLTAGWADQVFAVVPQDDERERFSYIWNIFKAMRAEITKTYLFGVYQSILPCGVGACQACMIPLRHGEAAYICTDGPAIDLTSVMLNL